MKDIKIILLIITLSNLLGCSSNNTDGKWVDYSNGMINLNTVEQINFGVINDVGDMGREVQKMLSLGAKINNSLLHISEKDWDKNFKGKTIKVTSYLKFDGFTLTLASKGISSYSELTDIKEDLLDTYDAIGDFIKDNNSYYELNDSWF